MLEPTQTTSAHIVVDLSRLTDMDAAGFRVLETCSQRSRWRGRRMFVAAPTGWVRRLIDVLCLDQVIPVYPSVEEALTACRSQAV